MDAAQAWTISDAPHGGVPSRGVALPAQAKGRFYGSLPGAEVEAELQRHATLLKGLLRDFAVMRDVVWHLQDEHQQVIRSMEQMEQTQARLATLPSSLEKSDDRLQGLATEVQRLRLDVAANASILPRAASPAPSSAGPAARDLRALTRRVDRLEGYLGLPLGRSPSPLEGTGSGPLGRLSPGPAVQVPSRPPSSSAAAAGTQVFSEADEAPSLAPAHPGRPQPPSAAGTACQSGSRANSAAAGTVVLSEADELAALQAAADDTAMAVMQNLGCWLTGGSPVEDPVVNSSAQALVEPPGPADVIAAADVTAALVVEHLSSWLANEVIIETEVGADAAAAATAPEQASAAFPPLPAAGALASGLQSPDVDEARIREEAAEQVARSVVAELRWWPFADGRGLGPA